MSKKRAIDPKPELKTIIALSRAALEAVLEATELMIAGGTPIRPLDWLISLIDAAAVIAVEHGVPTETFVQFAKAAMTDVTDLQKKEVEILQ
jgi:hypothetical protein